MATNYPSGTDDFTNPTGSDKLSSPDHASLHTNVNDAVEAMQVVMGTTAGTALFKNFSAGQFPAKRNNDTFGTPTVIGGTVQNSLIGTSTMQGGTINQARITNGTMVDFLIDAVELTNALVSSGTANGIVLGTPVIDNFTSSGTSLPSKANRALAPTVGTLTDSPAGTIAINSAAAQIFELTLGTTVGNRTLAAPTNPTDGQSLNFRIKQNAGATGTIVHNAIYRFSSESGTPILGTASTWNYYGYRYNQTNTKWDFVGKSINII